MYSGVAKSGSPAPKLTTLTPWAARARALASIVRVAEGAMAPTSVEIRDRAVADVCETGDASGGMGRVVPSDSLTASLASNIVTDERDRSPDYDPPRPAPVGRPVRQRPVQGADGGAGRPGRHRRVLHGHQPPPSQRPVRRGPGAGRSGGAVLPPRRVRGRPRQ